MKDVAEIAGVSIQTVSAVVNDKPEITAETRERVLAAIETLNYRPSLGARSLRTRKTHTIALVVSNITSVAIAAMAGAAEAHAYEFGYSLLFYDTQNDVERETNFFKTVVQQWVDGVIFIPAMGQLGRLDILQAAGIPSVAIDRVPENYDGPAVMLDNTQVGCLAGEHLLALGHTNLAHISGPRPLRLAQERSSGFLQALETAGMDPQGCLIEEGDFKCHSGYVAMQRLLARHPRPTAVFAANDLMAIGAMRAIDEAGLRMPADISIVGVDDIQVTAFQNPPLTTIHQPFTQLATSGVRLLLDLLQGQELAANQIVVEPTLVVRQSTGQLKERR